MGAPSISQFHREMGGIPRTSTVRVNHTQNLGAPGLAFETWDTTNSSSPVLALVPSSQPPPPTSQITGGFNHDPTSVFAPHHRKRTSSGRNLSNCAARASSTRSTRHYRSQIHLHLQWRSRQRPIPGALQRRHQPSLQPAIRIASVRRPISPGKRPVHCRPGSRDPAGRPIRPSSA